jgi:hypothetical protein
MSNVSPSLLHKTWNKGALPPCISLGIFRFRAKAGRCKLPAGQPEDKALQGCNLSAALEAGAGSEGLKSALAPPSQPVLILSLQLLFRN